MNFTKNDLLLYAVTDSSWTKNTSLDKQVEEAILGGATFVQLREKNLDFLEFVALGKKVKLVTDKYNIPYVINDNIDVAIKVDADGVHIGQSDSELVEARKRLGNDKIIGVSVQTVKQAKLAEKNGADYLGVGAIFTTKSKMDADDVSIDTLSDICKNVNIPVVAIGGINENNIEKLSKSGIFGVAIVSAIFASKDIKKSTSTLVEITKKHLETFQN